MEQHPLILVIDDDSDLCDATCELLEVVGYQSIAKTVPEEAIDAFRAEPSRFGLILLDWTLPRLSGAQVVRALQAIRPGVPIVVLSGLDENELRSAVQDLGVAAFLQKPYSYKDLLATLTRVTGS